MKADENFQENSLESRLERAQAKLVIKLTDKRGRLNNFEAKRAESLLSEFQKKEITDYSTNFSAPLDFESIATNQF